MRMQGRSSRARDVIEAWITAIVQDGGVERYDHLHIDKIDARWVHREHWLEGGTETFRLTRRVRDRRGLALIVALAYSLESGEAPRSMNFRAPDEFQAQLDWSPPSLYLFHPDREPWNQSGVEVVKPIDVTGFFRNMVAVARVNQSARLIRRAASIFFIVAGFSCP
jgi:hypothetical protein